MMDADLFIIMAMIVTVAAIIGVSANSIVKKVYEHKRFMRGGDPADGRYHEIADRTEMIEDRVRVLERLATDRGHLLADEIEALRDERREREVG